MNIGIPHKVFDIVEYATSLKNETQQNVIQENLHITRNYITLVKENYLYYHIMPILKQRKLLNSIYN